VGRDPSQPVYPAEFAATFDHFFEATHGPFACQRIVRTLQQDLGLGMSPTTERPKWQLRPGYRSKTRTRKHHSQVMPEIDAASVEQILQGFNRALGTQRRFQVEPCGQLLFHVHGAATRAEHELPGEIETWLRRLWSRPRAIGSPTPNPR
jgi:hypothetical protein